MPHNNGSCNTGLWFYFLSCHVVPARRLYQQSPAARLANVWLCFEPVRIIRGGRLPASCKGECRDG